MFLTRNPQYLKTLMPGLTAKVFRTYNASMTLQEQLTDPAADVVAMTISYSRSYARSWRANWPAGQLATSLVNRKVHVLCNHRHAELRIHEEYMANLEKRLVAKQEKIAEAERKLEDAEPEGAAHDRAKKALERLQDQMMKLEIKMVKEENKTFALGHYLDPRISVQWCKTHGMAVEKVWPVAP